MLIIDNEKHSIHSPDKEYFMQKVIPYNDDPRRIDSIRKGLSRIDKLEWTTPSLIDENYLKKIHNADYIDYIKNVSKTAENGSTYRTPFVIPSYPERLRGKTRQQDRVCYYAMDVTSPIGAGTYQAAIYSASIAYSGAHHLLKGKQRVVYGLCRPPGHHAESKRYGGYCYFNNAAVGAVCLSEFGKVTILDIDFHHGNGIQDIFYESDEVRYISIHADPLESYPYFCGYPDETGAGKGKGNNFNIVVPKNTDDNKYMEALEIAAKHIEDFKTDFLIVSVGYDTYIDDPVGGLLVTENGFRRIGAFISSLHLPTLIVQEGGYNIDKLGDLANEFVSGFIQKPEDDNEKS